MKYLSIIRWIKKICNFCRKLWIDWMESKNQWIVFLVTIFLIPILLIIMALVAVFLLTIFTLIGIVSAIGTLFLGLIVSFVIPISIAIKKLKIKIFSKSSKTIYPDSFDSSSL